MSQSTKSSDQSIKLRKVVGLGITDPNFRTMIAGKPIADIKQAIDKRQDLLEFNSTALTNESLSALSSVTPDELDVLSQIYEKVRNVPMEPNEMF